MLAPPFLQLASPRLSYMAKGIDPPFAAHFYLDHASQGHVAHRRIIISRCLGHAARRYFEKLEETRSRTGEARGHCGEG